MIPFYKVPIRSRSLAVCLFLLLWPGAARALDPGRSIEQYVHETWDVGDGLPEGPVLALHQTADGYLWLGTLNGLIRFDGLRFASMAAGVRGSSPLGACRDLLEDSAGTLFAAFDGGVAAFDGDAFRVFSAKTSKPPVFRALALGPEDTLWVGSDAGVWSLEKETLVRHPAYRASAVPLRINDLTVDGAGGLWAATDDGLLKLDRTVRRFTAEDGLPSTATGAILVDHRDTLWVGTRDGLARWEKEGFIAVGARGEGRFRGDVTGLFEDRSETLWMTTRDGGLHRLDKKTLRVDDGPPRGGSVVIEDQQGALWIGTDGGLERYRDGAFITYGRRDGFDGERILTIAPRKAGGVYAVDDTGGLYLLEKGRITPLTRDGAVLEGAPGDLLETGDDALWIGGRGLYRFLDQRLERFEVPDGEVSALARDRGGILLATTDGDGVSRLSRFEDGDFTPVHAEVPLNRVQRIRRDRHGGLWVATDGSGLVHIDSEGHRWFDQTDGLPHDGVFDAVEDSRGNLWVATRGGLARIRDHRVTDLSGVENTPVRSPAHLMPDALGALLVAAEDGIYRIPIADLEAAAVGAAGSVHSRIFTTADGLQSVAVSRRPAGQARTADGRLWYATARGLSVIDPDHLPKSSPPPKVIIEEAVLGNRQVQHPEALSVGEGREHIGFRYTVPSPNHANELGFRFRLRGYDDRWIDAGPRRFAEFTNISPGSYVFEVAAHRAAAPFGYGTALHLAVEPRWHETLPIRGLYLLAGLLLLAGVFQLGKLRMRRRARVLEGRIAKRTEALRQEMADRAFAEDEILQLSENLEASVQDRTEQLMALNQNLSEDIQIRASAEAALENDRELLLQVLDSLPDGVIATDPRGRVSLMNPAAERATGWTADTALGRRLSEVFPVADRLTRRPLSDLTARTLEAPAPDAPLLAVLTGAGGAEILVDTAAAAARDKGGRVVGAVFAFRDMTERIRTAEERRKDEKMEAVTLLADGIAREFDPLLMDVLGSLALARETLTEDTPESDWIRNAGVVLGEARSLTGRLLAFASEGHPPMAAHSLEDLVIRSTRFALTSAEVTAELGLQEGLWSCDMAPLQLRQVLDHLILNARQAMPSGGRITVTADNVELKGDNPQALFAGRYVRLSVADDGPGIPANIQKRIFTPFFTTKPSRSGLGLAAVRAIITKHGGAIDVRSAPEEGTVFQLHLRASNAVLRTPRSSFPPPAPTGNGSILLMDPEPYLRRLARMALVGSGYLVETAATGEAALSAFRQARDSGRPFDLVVLDFIVPDGMGGGEVLKQMRAIDPEIRAIAASGYPEHEGFSNPELYGFRRTLPKPYTVEDLRAAVAEAVVLRASDPPTP